LARGAIVISDRYIDSSLAYQGAGRTLPVEEVSWLSAWATGGLRPDLVVLLDIDPTIGLARVAGRGDSDRIEAENVAFHERVRYAFLDLAGADPARYLIADATMPADETAAIVLERVSAMLPPAPVAGGDIEERPEEVPAPPTAPEILVQEMREPPTEGGNGNRGGEPQAPPTIVSNLERRS